MPRSFTYIVSDYGRHGSLSLFMPKSTQPPSHNAIRRLEPYARLTHVAPEPRRRPPLVSRPLSLHSDIFVRTLMADLLAEEEKAERDNKLELCLFVDVIPVRLEFVLCGRISHCRVQGKTRGCFVDPDLFILMLSVWSPLPMPCRPMATVQLDRFVGVDRSIPTAPLWLAKVHGTRKVPLKFFRTAHWVREQVRAMLSFPIMDLGPDIFRDYSLLVEKIDELIVSHPVIIIDYTLIEFHTR